MKFIVATLSLFVLVFMTGSIIFALTGLLAPEVFTAKQIEPAINPDAECERVLTLGGWGCKYNLGQRRRESALPSTLLREPRRAAAMRG